MLTGFLIRGLLPICLVAAIAGPGHGAETDLVQGFDRCKAIADDRARLRCLQDLVEGRENRPTAPPQPGASAPAASNRVLNKGGLNQGPLNKGPWRLLRTPDPNGGREAVSVTRPADLFRSEPDFVGLMIRCGEASRLEVLVAVLQPLPLRAHPTVKVAAGGRSLDFAAAVAPPGALILLPAEATELATGDWRSSAELDITVQDRELTLHGVVPLDGLSAAISTLRANCPSDAPPPPR